MSLVQACLICHLRSEVSAVLTRRWMGCHGNHFWGEEHTDVSAHVEPGLSCLGILCHFLASGIVATIEFVVMVGIDTGKPRSLHHTLRVERSLSKQRF